MKKRAKATAGEGTVISEVTDLSKLSTVKLIEPCKCLKTTPCTIFDGERLLHCLVFNLAYITFSHMQLILLF